MKRELTNKIRFALEELVPPIVRDTHLMRLTMKLVWGKHIDSLARFRQRAPFLSADEYEELYRNHPRVHSETDNSAACIERICETVEGDSVVDIGCGTGALLQHVREAHPSMRQIVGVDFVVDAAEALPGIDYVAARIEDLPFEDDAFDTVICTHVLEHVLDFRTSLSELRRIARRRLIIVVPREREALYTFNPHFNFFPYKHSFLRFAWPIPAEHLCENIGRDIFYTEVPNFTPKTPPAPNGEAGHAREGTEQV